MPAVSVLMPVYNGATHLGQAIASVLAQSCEDFELVIVDDGSSDGSLDVATTAAAGDRRVRVERNAANLGLVGNWRRCVELSRGEWLKFAFQDDLLGPDCLGRMMDAARSGRSPLVLCRRELLFEAGVNQALRDYLERLAGSTLVPWGQGFLAADAVAALAVEHLGLNVLGEPTAVLLHRNCFARFGYFNTTLRQACDYEYWIRVGSNVGISLVGESLAAFRVHPQSTSAANFETGQFLTVYADPLVLIEEYLRQPHYAALRQQARRLPRELALSRQRDGRIRWLLGSLARSGDAPARHAAIASHLAGYPALAQRLRWRRWRYPIDRWLERTLWWRFRKPAKEHVA